MKGNVLVVAAALCLGLVTRAPAAIECKLLGGIEGGDRIPLLFLAEGYTEEDRPRYDSLVKQVGEALFATTPFREYRNYFTVYSGWTPSRVSGGGNSPDSTFFHSRFDFYGMKIPATAAKMASTDTSFHCRDRPASFVLNAHSVILIQGASDPFGRAYLGQNTVIVGDFRAAATLPHELGHDLGWLWDEYETKTGVSGFSPSGEPLWPIRNVVATTNLDSVPWRSWISASTPIPTPKTSEYDTVVGLFEGADYSSTGRYRSQQSCMMQSADWFRVLPFCKVCRESLTAALLNRIAPFNAANQRLRYDSVFPPPKTVVTGGEILLRRIPLDTFPLEIHWTLDGVPLPGLGEAVDVAKLPKNGILEAVVAGTSGFIRAPGYVVHDTLRWTVRKASGGVARKGREDRIRRIGPGLFLVPGGSELPVARDPQGRKLALVEVATISEGRIVRVDGGVGAVLLESSSRGETHPVATLR